MTEINLTLFTLRGIRVGVNYTIIFPLSMIVVALATTILPQEVPGATPVGLWSFAIIGALLFYGSLLSHEFGHAIVAQRAGIKAESVTLFLLGGVLSLLQSPKTAKEEFQVAAAGPLVSLALAPPFAILAFVTGGLVSAVFMYAAVTNVAIGVFNLLPTYPMDGGRILRSILWFRSNDPKSSTIQAAWVGRIGGYLAMVGGFLITVLTGTSGIGISVLGYFIARAATDAIDRANGDEDDEDDETQTGQ